MNRRDAVLVLGVAAAVTSLAMAAVPALGGGVDLWSSLPFLVGVVALALACLRGRGWLGHDERAYDPTQLERPTGGHVAGADFDETVRRAPPMGASGGPGGADTRRANLRQTLRETTVETLTRYEGYSPEEARLAVDRGTWTDDPYAARFFTSARGTGGSVVEAVRDAVEGADPFQRRVHHVAAELERRSRGDSE